MIVLKEIIGKAKIEDQPEQIQTSLKELLEKINKVRSAWAKPMTVTSGLRTMADHLRIYAEKGITDQSKIPMKSHHLYGRAVDISDPNKDLQKWCKANEALLAEIGLWMEDFSATPNWCHFQIVPPKSGKRWFMP
jgi:uncharacterized protein YcbK (DUF882 family)